MKQVPSVLEVLDSSLLKGKPLTIELDEFTDKDHEYFADFINWDEFDLERMRQVHILDRDEKFESAEVVCIMEDELQIKCRGNVDRKIHNENLAMDFRCNVEADWELSILKKDISGVRVSRRTSCDCAKCQERQSENDYRQPEGYEIDILVSGRDISVVVYSKELAFHLKQCIQYWLLSPIKLTKKMMAK